LLDPRMHPADRILLGYNLALTGVWLSVGSDVSHAPSLAAAHLSGVGLFWLFSRLPRSAGAGMRLLRQLYPLLFVAAFWIELDLVRPALDLEGIDAQISALDRFLFGVHLHEIWLPRMNAVRVSEAMYFFYYAYYPAVYLPPTVLAVLGRETAARDMVFRLTATYLACFAFYIAFPVDGPHFFMEPTPGPHTEGFFYGLVQMAQQIGSSRGCTFPSSHAAGAATMAVLAWRWLPRWAGALLTLEAIGVMLSTTYTQFHFLVDSIAGVMWALIFNFVLAEPLARALGGRGRGVRDKEEDVPA
jgi:membrane-associated phospholipid phosphatase